MDLTPFKRDIDELIDEFSKGNSTTLADMKRVWLSRKFSFIYEASPSTNLAFFMQSLYAHSIGYMVSAASLSFRLAGLYSLYCLYETQPFKPPFKIYLSLGELKRLKRLVIDSKENNINVVPALVKKMLEKNIFLFGFIDINEGSVTERVNEITYLQNARVKVAYEKLLANTPIEHFLDLDLGTEFDLKRLKKLSMEYAKSKELAIREAGELADIRDIRHIAEDKKPIEDIMENISEKWNAQKENFHQQTGLKHHPSEPKEEEANGDLDKELEQLLSQ